MQPNSNRTETGLLETKPVPRNGLLQKALLFLMPAPTPPTSSVTRLIMRHRHTRAAVTTGKGEGGADVTKSAAFRNGTRACTTMGISTAGEVGHYTEIKALISATAHEDMQKPFDFAIFGRQWRVCVTGQVSVTKLAAFRKGIYAKLYKSCEDSAQRPHFNSRRN